MAGRPRKRVLLREPTQKQILPFQAAILHEKLIHVLKYGKHLDNIAFFTLEYIIIVYNLYFQKKILFYKLG